MKSSSVRDNCKRLQSAATLGRGPTSPAECRHHRQPPPASTPQSGARAGYDRGKRKNGSKLHLAVDTFEHFLAMHVTPANSDDRAEVGRMTKAIQGATEQNAEIAFVDHRYIGERSAQAARKHGIELEVIKLDEAKRGFISSVQAGG